MKIRFADTPARRANMRWCCRSRARIDRASRRWAPRSRRSSRALDRQRFEGDASSVAEQFIDDGRQVRRLLVVGTGTGSDAARGRGEARRHGGRAAADVGRNEGRDRPERPRLSMPTLPRASGLAAALRSWRYDRYRTKLKDKQKPTLDEVVIVGGGTAPRSATSSAGRRLYEGVSLTRELVTEPANIIYPEKLRRARPRARSRAAALEIEVLDRAAMEKLGMGALLGVAQGSVREARDCWSSSGMAAAHGASRWRSSARA